MKRSILLLAFLSCFSSLFTAYAAKSQPSLKKQVGQMLIVGLYGTQVSANSPIVDVIKKYNVGGIMLYARENDMTRNIANPAQLKSLTAQLQHYAKLEKLPKLFIATDQEGGKISNLSEKKGFYFFSNLSQYQLGLSHHPVLAEDQAYGQGTMMKRLGINLNFAPVVDLRINPDNPAIAKLQRSYGVDANYVAKMAAAQIKGYQKAGVLCALKHFPGLGSAASNTDFNDADVTATWSPRELIPYKALINEKQACSFVMVTHLIDRKLDKTGELASFSKIIVTKLLRNKLHFTGLIITDNLDAKAVTLHNNISQAVTKALLAGNDIILVAGTEGNNPYQDAKVAFNTIYNLAKHSGIIRKQISASYQRIMQVKKTLAS